MARAAYLWLHRGRWRDRQLLDADLMARATAGGPLGDGEPYKVEGWQFHLVRDGLAWESPRELKLPGVPDGTFMARDGGDNQGTSHGSVVVVPTLELVMAMAAPLFCLHALGPANRETMTGPGTPAAPAWMCAAVVLSMPATSTRKLRMLSSNTASRAVPVAAVLTAGTSSGPLSVAVNSSAGRIGYARSSPQAATPANSPAAIRLHNVLLRMAPPFTGCGRDSR